MENIPQYKAPEGADLGRNMYVVDVKDPDSIASVLKHIIDNFDDFIDTIYDNVGNGDTFHFGIIDDSGEFVSLRENSPMFYDEEVFSAAATSYPELYPLLAELAELIIGASENETVSGPWATEETILGQFIIPDLAGKDEEYMELLWNFMNANVEILCSSRFQQYFEITWEGLCEKWGIDPEEYGDNEDDDGEMYIEVSEAIDADWDELLEQLKKVDDINKKDKKQLDSFVEKSNEYEYKYVLFDNGITFVATNQADDEVYLNQPYISLKINVANYGYGNSAGISSHDSGYIELDLPGEVGEIVYDFLAGNGYGAQEIERSNVNSVNYAEDKNLDLNNISLPADTDFCDTTLDQEADTFEIWHNTALISRIYTVLLERESWTNTESLVLKQYIADIPNFTDMYLSNVMKTNIIISCIRKKEKSDEYDYQMISFMLAQNIIAITNTTNGSTMTHMLLPENKETIIKLLEVHKPEWVKNLK